MKKTSNARNLIVKMASLVISVLIGFVQTRLVVERIGSEQYGFYSLSNDFVNYAMIISIALNSMSGRYISISYHQGLKKDSNEYFNSVLFANVCLGCILLLPFAVIILLLPNIISIPKLLIADVKILFSLMFFNFILTILFSVFAIATFTKNRIDLDSYRNIESNFIRLCMIWVLFRIFDARIYYLGFAAIASTLYVGMTNIYYTKKLLPEMAIDKNCIDGKKIKKVLKAGVWNSYTRVSSVLLNGLDLLIANLAVGSAAMGTISVAKTLPKMFISSMNSLAGVFSPSITEKYAKGDREGVIDGINRSIKVNSLFSTAGLVILFVLGKRLFELWVPSQDAGQLQVLSVVSMSAYVILMPLEILWTVFTLTNKVKISSIYLTVESLVTIGIVFILLHVLDTEMEKMIVIVGVSALFEIFRGLFFLPYVSAALLHMKKLTFYSVIARVVCSFTCSFAVCWFLNTLWGKVQWFGLAVLSVLLLAVSLLLSSIILFNSSEKKMMLSLIVKKWKG